MRRRRIWMDDEREFGLQIAPLLDLLFVLLLFFMVTAGSRQREREVALSVAPATAVTTTPNENELAPLRIDIDAWGQVFFNQAPIDSPQDRALPELRQRLSEAMSDARGAHHDAPIILLTPREKTSHQRVVDVLHACAAEHFTRLAFGESEN